MGEVVRSLVADRMRTSWLCRGCGWKNELAKRKCANPDCSRSRPAKRVPQHAKALRDHDYEHYRELNAIVHGPAMPPDWSSDDCGCCGRSAKGTRRLDRDHGHDRSEITYGRPRGLACPGDWGCNKLMSRLTLAKAREIVAYLERIEDHYRAAEEAA